MGDVIRISTRSLRSDADRVKELNDALPGLVKELEESMQQLSNCWEGLAWAGFQQTTAYYIEVLTEVYQYMGTYTENMQKASQDYERTEQDLCTAL
ncbi:MAG: WXG100 family type VII secretion target [Lachnospiraceae bacterium]|nr:WXG100 family type VII secretion target [Lachnospiraceae bacterium]MBO5144285.1 WXG100 family type VII secretion target [Lachnospiraceae bacterium]